MKFIYSIAASLLFLTSCGGGGWSDEQKQQAIDACKNGSDEKVCSCYIEKVAAKYGPGDMASGDEAAMKEISQMMLDCMAEARESAE